MALSADTDTLTTMISTLVDLSMDGRFSDDEQQEFLVLAKRLRGTLLNLLSARFDAGTPSVLAANNSLTSVNTQVQALSNDINGTANAIASVTNLVGQLDGLLKVATTFV
jgi:hypothetical protein